MAPLHWSLFLPARRASPPLCMTDSASSSPNNALSNSPSSVLRNAALSSSVLGEDDEEPPSCSGVRRLPSQMISGGDAGSINTKSYNHALQHENTITTIDISEKSAVQKTLPQGPVYATSKDRFKALFTPTVPITGPPPTFWQSCKATVKYTPLNICLLFIPVSWALHYTHQSATLIFIFSCLGIIPLAALLGFGTEQIAVRTSSAVGGLLNATLGNVVEMIIAGIALKEVRPVPILRFLRSYHAPLILVRT